MSAVAVGAGGMFAGPAGLYAFQRVEPVVTVPVTGASHIMRWAGTIPAGSRRTGDCPAPVPGRTAAESRAVRVRVLAAAPAGATTTYRFRIVWSPISRDASTADEILTVRRVGLAGAPRTTASAALGSSNGNGTVETVVAKNLAPGEYEVLACGATNLVEQPYAGTLTVTTTR
jgi:hypothetical protein